MVYYLIEIQILRILISPILKFYAFRRKACHRFINPSSGLVRGRKNNFRRNAELSTYLYEPPYNFLKEDTPLGAQCWGKNLSRSRYYISSNTAHRLLTKVTLIYIVDYCDLRDNNGGGTIIVVKTPTSFNMRAF